MREVAGDTAGAPPVGGGDQPRLGQPDGAAIEPGDLPAGPGQAAVAVQLDFGAAEEGGHGGFLGGRVGEEFGLRRHAVAGGRGGPAAGGILPAEVVQRLRRDLVAAEGAGAWVARGIAGIAAAGRGFERGDTIPEQHIGAAPRARHGGGDGRRAGFGRDAPVPRGGTPRLVQRRGEAGRRARLVPGLGRCHPGAVNLSGRAHPGPFRFKPASPMRVNNP